MLAKKTSKNQITLPKAIVGKFPDVEYFDVKAEKGRIVLLPVAIGRADEVRARLASLGLDGQDVADAVAWARKS